MELRHLRTFVTVAETLNISEAARRLRVTQPGLSRNIRELEQSVGQALFVRQPGGLRLTLAGAKLRESGAKAITAFDDALAQARGAQLKPVTTLRVGYYGTVSMWATVVAPAMQKLRRESPPVTLRFTEGSTAQLATDLREGHLDVTLLGPGDAARRAGIISILAAEVPAVVMLPADHRLAKKRILALGELKGEEFVSFVRHLVPGRDRTLIARCRAEGFIPRIAAVAAALPELVVEVTARSGVALVTPFAQKAPHPGVVFAKLRPPGVPLAIHVAYSPHGPRSAKRAAELLAAEARRAVSEHTG